MFGWTVHVHGAALGHLVEPPALDVAVQVALKSGGTTEYDPAKPWDFLWKLAGDKTDGQESRWWYREFERKIPIIKERGVINFVEGDARIANSIATRESTDFIQHCYNCWLSVAAVGKVHQATFPNESLQSMNHSGGPCQAHCIHKTSCRGKHE